MLIAPESVESAAQELSGIHSAIAQASQSIIGSTATITPAAADEVSTAIATMFGDLGREFQALDAQAQAFHADFVKTLNSAVDAYLGTEVANAAIPLAGIAPPAGAVPAASILDILGNPGVLLSNPGALPGRDRSFPAPAISTSGHIRRDARAHSPELSRDN